VTRLRQQQLDQRIATVEGAFRRLRPAPGRFGFHWHDGTHHTHCVDPAHPDRDRHFAGGPVDLFAAFDRFTMLLNGKEPLTCAGLLPLRG
jgi:hypothetical protein